MFNLSGKRGARITVAALILISDQILKFLFYNKDFLKEELTLIKGFFYVVPATQNPGIAFGLFQNHGRLFIIPASIVILSLLFLYLRTSGAKTLFKWGLLLILTGALSNLIDRTVYGFVIDYLILNKFPYSFNIADTAILTGVGLIMIKIIQDSKRKKLMGNGNARLLAKRAGNPYRLRLR